MKTLLLILMILFTHTIQAQSIKLVNGKYITVKKDTTSKKANTTPIGEVYVDKNGKEYPLYKGSKGGIFAMVPNKDGVYKKKYMPKQ